MKFTRLVSSPLLLSFFFTPCFSMVGTNDLAMDELKNKISTLMIKLIGTTSRVPDILSDSRNKKIANDILKLQAIKDFIGAVEEGKKKFGERIWFSNINNEKEEIYTTTISEYLKGLRISYPEARARACSDSDSEQSSNPATPFTRTLGRLSKTRAYNSLNGLLKLTFKCHEWAELSDQVSMASPVNTRTSPDLPDSAAYFILRRPRSNSSDSYLSTSPESSPPFDRALSLEEIY